MAESWESVADQVTDAAETFLSKRFPGGPVGVWRDREPSEVAALMSELDTLGWPLLLVPESAGGIGGTAAEVWAFFRSAGQHLVPAPLLDLVITGPLLRGVADAGAVPEGLTVSAGRGPEVDGQCVTGMARFVESADLASAVVVTDEERVLLVPTDQDAVEIRRQPTLDVCARPAEVVFRDAKAFDVLTGPAARQWQRTTERMRRLAVAAETAGVARRCVEDAARYAGQRTQFDRPIGAFQAIAHLLAEMWVDTYALDALGEWAAHDENGADEAKALAAEIGSRVARTGLQVHGAIGYTDELPYHFFYKRAMTLATLEGVRDEVYAAVGRRAVGR